MPLAECCPFCLGLSELNSPWKIAFLPGKKLEKALNFVLLQTVGTLCHVNGKFDVLMVTLASTEDSY